MGISQPAPSPQGRLPIRQSSRGRRWGSIPDVASTGDAPACFPSLTAPLSLPGPGGPQAQASPCPHDSARRRPFLPERAIPPASRGDGPGPGRDPHAHRTRAIPLQIAQKAGGAPAFRFESLPAGPVNDPASAPGLLRRIHAFLTESPALAQALGSALPIMAAPNPASRAVTFYHDALSAPGVSGGQVRVYNVAGRLVRTLSLNPGGRTVWDLTDDFGRPPASGLYLWLAFYPDGRRALQRPQRLVIQR